MTYQRILSVDILQRDLGRGSHFCKRESRFCGWAEEGFQRGRILAIGISEKYTENKTNFDIKSSSKSVLSILCMNGPNDAGRSFGGCESRRGTKPETLKNGWF